MDSQAKTDSYHEVGEILSWHEALFSSIRKNEILKSQARLSLEDSRLLEAKVIRQSLEITRSHGIYQASLKSAINLSHLAEPSLGMNMNIDGVAKFDLANVLWDQGEMTASIRMLQQLKDQNDLPRQTIPLSRAELLVTLVSCVPVLSNHSSKSSPDISMCLAQRPNLSFRVIM
jgi:ataxia telangiectasia mutated family protein